MMKIILSLIILFCNLFSQAQTFTKTIERNTVASQAYNIYPGKNGNYYIAGVDSREVFIIKFNNVHDTVWTRSYDFIDFYSVEFIETNDGGYAILAFDQGAAMYLVRFDSLGFINLSKSYEAVSHQIGSKLIQTQDSCFLLCASVTHIGNPSYYYNQLIKVDQFGDTLWTKEIPSNFLTFDILEYNRI